MNAAELFAELEGQAVHTMSAGTLERRISTESACDLFLGVQKPGNTRSLRVRFASAAAPDPLQLPSFRGLELGQQCLAESGREYLTVALRAVNPAFSSVFTSLAEDVARHVSQLQDEGQAAAAFFGRLVQWQRLLERRGAEGLDAEEQRGLYGELWFLRERVLTGLSVSQSVSAWTGPERTAKDFQFPGCAVEVKTTMAGQHQHLQIAGEKQLDDTGLDALFLCHLSLEVARGAGETLPAAVTSLRAAAAAIPAAAQTLEDRLLEVGYLDAHAALYAAVGYVLREVSI